MRRFKSILFALLLLCGICAIGCGGGNNTGGFTAFIPTITSITLSPKPVTRAAGQTQQFTATATANDGTSFNVNNGLIWSSSNSAVVSVDANGLATANTAGSAVITASGAGFTDTASFTVTGTGTTVNLVALDSSGTSLVRFTSTDPANPNNFAVSGLVAGDVLVGLDVRPQNRFLYGLGFNSGAGTVRIYFINPDNGVANPLGDTPVSFVTAGGAARPVSGSGFGFDFNPVADRIRVVTSSGQNFRLNPNNGSAVDGDGGNAGIQMDGDISGATTTADAAAYTNNQANTSITTLYTLDRVSRSLYLQSPPNNGTQGSALAITVGGNPLDFSAVNGFDIAPGVNAAASNAPVATGSGLAALTVNGTTNLYSLNLVNGQATLLGILNANLSGLTILPPANDQPALALDNANAVVRFNVSTPGTVTTQATSGLVAGETLVGLDFRPATGQLFGLGINAAANTGTVYLIDPQTGALSVVGGGGSVAFTDGINPIDLPDPATSGYGFDFNPTADRIRVTTSTGLNFRLNQITGQPVDADLGTAGTNPDGTINGSGATGISGAAYTNSFAGATATTLYTLDDANNRLLIQNPPNNGTQTSPLAVTLGGNPLDFSSINGFDIPRNVSVATSNTAANGFATAALSVGGITGLYTINLATAATTFQGAIGAGGPLSGLTLGN